MGAGVFHGRVRDGIGCGHPAITTRFSNPPLVWIRGDIGSGAVLWGLCGDCGDLWMISMHGVVSFLTADIEPIGRLGPVS